MMMMTWRMRLAASVASPAATGPPGRNDSLVLGAARCPAAPLQLAANITAASPSIFARGSEHLDRLVLSNLVSSFGTVAPPVIDQECEPLPSNSKAKLGKISA